MVRFPLVSIDVTNWVAGEDYRHYVLESRWVETHCNEELRTYFLNKHFVDHLGRVYKALPCKWSMLWMARASEVRECKCCKIKLRRTGQKMSMQGLQSYLYQHLLMMLAKQELTEQDLDIRSSDSIASVLG